MSESDTQATFSEESCVICKKIFGDDDHDKVTMYEKGIQVVIESSRRRKDDSLLQYLLSQPRHVRVHGNCRHDYVKSSRKRSFNIENPVVKSENVTVALPINTIDNGVEIGECGTVVSHGSAINCSSGSYDEIMKYDIFTPLFEHSYFTTQSSVVEEEFADNIVQLPESDNDASDPTWKITSGVVYDETSNLDDGNRNTEADILRPLCKRDYSAIHDGTMDEDEDKEFEESERIRILKLKSKPKQIRQVVPAPAGATCIVHYDENTGDVLRPLTQRNCLRIRESVCMRQSMDAPKHRLDDMCAKISTDAFDLNRHAIHSRCYKSFTDILRYRNKLSVNEIQLPDFNDEIQRVESNVEEQLPKFSDNVALDSTTRRTSSVVYGDRNGNTEDTEDNILRSLSKRNYSAIQDGILDGEKFEETVPVRKQKIKKSNYLGKHSVPAPSGATCIVHFDENTEVRLRGLSEMNCLRIQECVRIRQTLSKPSQRLDDVCARVPCTLDVNRHAIHGWCYWRFTNISKYRQGSCGTKLQLPGSASEPRLPEIIKKGLLSKSLNSPDHGFSPIVLLTRLPDLATCSQIPIPSLAPSMHLRTDVCLFCGAEEKDGSEVLNICTKTQTEDDIKRSAEQKGDTVLLAKIDGIDMVGHEVKFHQSCVCEYTVPERLLLPKVEDVTMTKALRTDLCLFCGAGKVKHHKKDAWEVLTKCATTRIEDNIKRSAKQKGDFAMLEKINDIDMIAHEVKFHRSCARKYTLPVRPKGDGITEAHSKAFELIVAYVDTHIIEGRNVELMTTLIAIYMEHVKKSATYNTYLFPKKNLSNFMKELIVHYGNRLSFWDEKIVYSSSLTLSEGVEKLLALREVATEDEKIKDAAKVLRRSIIDPVEIASEDILSTTIPVPDLGCALRPPPPILVEFINQVITGNVSGAMSSRFRMISNSIAEQITFVCTDSV